MKAPERAERGIGLALGSRGGEALQRGDDRFEQARAGVVAPPDPARQRRAREEDRAERQICGREDGAPPPVDVKPTTVTVTLPSGEKFDGRLDRVDDFTVALTLADGTRRTFKTSGDVPKVEIHDPLQPHKDLLRTYADADIHNVTAYLVTLK